MTQRVVAHSFEPVANEKSARQRESTQKFQSFRYDKKCENIILTTTFNLSVGFNKYNVNNMSLTTTKKTQLLHRQPAKTD